MKQFTSKKGNFDQEDIQLMKKLFPKIKSYDARAFSYDMLDIMPIPLLVSKTDFAFIYNGYDDINYLREVA